MIETLEHIDHIIFLFLNGLHASSLDPIMKFVSSKMFWLPVVALFLFLIIKKYKKHFWIPLVFAAACFVITDQTSHLTKENYKRYRPTHNVELAQDVHIVEDYRGGEYGFFSGHASNSFGLAIISLLFVRRKWYTYTLISWAVLVSYSRIYLGVHFPSDIFVGMAFGSLVAFLFWKIQQKLPFTNKLFLDNS